MWRRETVAPAIWTAVGASASVIVPFFVAFDGPLPSPTPERLVPGGEAAIVCLVAVGVVAGLIGRGYGGWIGTMVGTAIAALVGWLARVSYASVMWGASVAMDRWGFIAAVLPFVAAPFVIVSGAYLAVRFLLRLRAQTPLARPTPAPVRIVAAWAAALALGSVVFAFVLSGTALRIGEGEPGVVALRMSVTADAISMNATRIPGGDLILLATTARDGPSVNLEKVDGSTSIGITYPGQELSDYSIGPLDLTPGEWRLASDDGRLVFPFVVE
jgi:hypothetical protein